MVNVFKVKEQQHLKYQIECNAVTKLILYSRQVSMQQEPTSAPRHGNYI